MAQENIVDSVAFLQDIATRLPHFMRTDLDTPPPLTQRSNIHPPPRSNLAVGVKVEAVLVGAAALALVLPAAFTTLGEALGKLVSLPSH